GGLLASGSRRRAAIDNAARSCVGIMSEGHIRCKSAPHFETSQNRDEPAITLRVTIGCEQAQQCSRYSITSSARASSIGGTSRPSVSFLPTPINLVSWTMFALSVILEQ